MTSRLAPFVVRAWHSGALDDLLKPENKEKLKAVLTFHVVAGRVSSADAANAQTVITVGGKELPLRVEVSGLAGAELRGALRVGETKVVTADIRCTNGGIHVIDACYCLSAAPLPLLHWRYS